MMEILNKLKAHTVQSTGTTGKVTCPLCKGEKQVKIIKKGRTYYTLCQCVLDAEEKKWSETILESSGIGEAFRSKTLEGFVCNNPERQSMIVKATAFCEGKVGASFLALGQVGSGKTHITVGIANKLMQAGVPVRYAQYGTMINDLLSAKKDAINYVKVADHYRKARVLLIDDLFKGAVSTWDGSRSLKSNHLELVFQIINYRYLNKLPIIISSELDPTRLLDLDEGIASRLLEMAGKNIIVVNDVNMNYRIFKAVG